MALCVAARHFDHVHRPARHSRPFAYPRASPGEVRRPPSVHPCALRREGLVGGRVNGRLSVADLDSALSANWRQSASRYALPCWVSIWVSACTRSDVSAKGVTDELVRQVAADLRARYDLTP